MGLHEELFRYRVQHHSEMAYLNLQRCFYHSSDFDSIALFPLNDKAKANDSNMVD